MKSTVPLFQAFVAIASARLLNPRQGIDTSLADSQPSPTTASIPIGPTFDSTTYDMSKATASATESPLPVGTEPVTHRERDIYARQTACQPNPTGSGPKVTPDTDSAFVGNSAFATAASQAPKPTGYNQTFSNLHARAEAYGYLGFVVVDSYDTAGCADQCSTVFRGCQSFNIFYERDPIVAPSSGCNNPPSTTNIKCVFWGGDLPATTASNDGQYLADFHVVIAGSNGYLRNRVPSVPGYSGEPTGNNTIDAPPDDLDPDPGDTTTTTDISTSTTTGTFTNTSTGTSTSTAPTSTTTRRPGRGATGTYIGSKIFTNTYFDPQLCAAACDAQNRNNLENPPRRGRPQICRFFSTYLIYRNGEPIGQYCALYTTYYSRSFATNSVSTTKRKPHENPVC